MEPRLAISVVANFLVVVGLVIYAFSLFAEYESRGRWAKNITGLLAGVGLMVLAIALLLTPANARTIMKIAQSGASEVLLWVSTGLLLAAIAAFGAITYWRPLRLLYERKIESDLHRELPKVP
jgi:hypothetical protein